MHIRVLPDQPPIDPIGFVVLTVGIVIAALGSSDFIAHEKHGQTKRQHCDGEEILHLSVSESLNYRIIGGPLDATVPASIVVSAVAVVFAVGLVMFLVVRD